MELVIGVDSVGSEDVRALLGAHLSFARGATPAAFSFALDADELTEAGVTFFSARQNGVLIAIAALKRLDDHHAELKSMHTREPERGRGVGTAMVGHILAFAGHEGYRQVSLETGSTEEFVSARRLYRKVGFRPCEPFGDYATSPYNTFMTIDIDLASRAPTAGGPTSPDLAGGAGGAVGQAGRPILGQP